jgi:hypothetical protein
MIDCSNQLFSNFASGEESNEEKDDEDNNGEEADNQSEASNQAATAEESNQHQGVEQDIQRATMTTATEPPAGAPSSSPFNMNFFSPYIIFTYIEEDVQMITINFIVIVSDGHGFQLMMVVPNFFAKEACL